MLTVVDRYLLREVALAFGATLLVLLAMVLSYRLARLLSEAASGLLAQDSIWLLLGLQAVRYLVLLVPLAAMLSIMLSLGRLYRDSEMTALRAGGVGPLQIYKPLFLMALPLAALVAWLALIVVPQVLALKQQVTQRAQSEAELSLFTPGTFRKLAGGAYVLYVGGLGDNGHELKDVFVRSQTENGQAVTTARSGRQHIDPRTGDRYIVLSNGFRYEGQPSAGAYTTIKFQRLGVRVDTVEQASTANDQETLPTSKLMGNHKPSLQAELQARLSAPLSLILLVLLAPLLAHAPPREGRYGRVFVALLVYTVYVNLLNVGQAWLARGQIWPALGLWWVHALLLLLIAGFALRHYPPAWLTWRRASPA